MNAKIEDQYNESKSQLFEVEKIIETRKRGKQAQYLVKWKGYDEACNTWEPASHLTNCKELLNQFLEKKTQNKQTRTKLLCAKKQATIRPRTKGNSRTVKQATIRPITQSPSSKRPKVQQPEKATIPEQLRLFESSPDSDYVQIKEIKSVSTKICNKIEYPMEIEDTIEEQTSVKKTKAPLFDKTKILLDKKYSTSKDIKTNEDLNLFTGAIGTANSVLRHMLIDNGVYFICEWTNKIDNFNYGKYCINIDEMEKHNSKLLISYLKTCLIKEIN